jgi:hypothetical protein
LRLLELELLDDSSPPVVLPTNGNPTLYTGGCTASTVPVSVGSRLPINSEGGEFWP